MTAWLEAGAVLLGFALAAVWAVGHMPGLMVLCWYPVASRRRIIRGEIDR